MDVFGRWAEIMRLPEADVPLDEAALLISAAANRDLDVAAEMGRLDDLAGSVPGRDVGSLCWLLFDRIGLEGDRHGYDNPANSYLDRVIDRRRGIPISLSVLLIEVGRRAGVALEPVGMPAHFLVRDPSEPDLLIDAFGRGRRLDRDGCARIVSAASGGAATFDPGMLATTGKWAVIARMLANLDRSFERRGDRASLATVTELRRMLPEATLGDRAQLAGRLASAGRFDAAADLLEHIAEAVGTDTGTERLRRQAFDLRARLN